VQEEGEAMKAIERAADVFRSIARGDDEIVSCQPEWTKAWCEIVHIKTNRGFAIDIFHRWGVWKYTARVYDNDGNTVWHCGMYVSDEPQYLLDAVDTEALHKVLNPVDPEHYYNKREALRITDPEKYHREEAKRLREFFDGSSDSVRSGPIGQHLRQSAELHHREAFRISRQKDTK
jgi:hypothetical protein